MKALYYKIEISYDGTGFCGWQRQALSPTVQRCLEEVFFRVFGNTVRILAASRTDSGVHATGQVAVVSFKNFGLLGSRLFKIWNDNLPEAILIKNFVETDSMFNPQHNVVVKVYTYDLFLCKASPLISRFGWIYPQIHKVDWKCFAEYLKLFVGFHNFSSFCRIDPDAPKNPWRTVDMIKLSFLSQNSDFLLQLAEEDLFSGFFVTGEPEKATVCRVLFKSKGFLHFQIRRMLGAALQYSLSSDKLLLQDSKNTLAGLFVDPEKVPSFCVASKGLTLCKIFYSS